MIKRKPFGSLIDNAWHHEVEGYVGFTKALGTRWWDRFLSPAFGHCFVVVKRGELLILMTPNNSHTQLEVYSWPDGDIHDHFDGVLVPFKERIDVRPIRYRGLIGPITCVELVKSVLGIKNPLVFTPFQLYKHMTGECDE